jgi:tRNA(Ile)-lysidine synthase TilS/MesJ
MTECSVTNNVLIWRPFLPHPKTLIYDFAHKYGVPYFKDTTPSWSTRGQLRNTLIPALLQVYGAGCLKNLSMLAVESDDMRLLVQENLYSPFMQSVRYDLCGLKVKIEGTMFKHQPQSFWREALKQLMHSMGMAMVRDKVSCKM